MKRFDVRLFFAGIISLFVLTLAGPAYAACTMPNAAPDAVEGDVVYNLDHHVMQFCNGSNWMSMGGGGGSSLPTCADDEILQYNDPGDDWECVAMSAAEVDPQVNTLTNNKWCTSNGTVVNCASDLPIGTLTNAKYCTTDGTTISCTSDGPAETDPQVGTLTNTKWCTTDGTAINCASDAPAESDPQVGTLTNTKWCTTNGTTINCTSDAPSGGGATHQVFDASGTWTKPGSGTVAMVECWGGGGSGARDQWNPGGGGGGGGYNMKWIALSSLGATETVTVGAGGASQTVNNTAGNTGGTSSFGTHVYAYGGGGGSTSGGGGGGGPQGAGSNTGTPGAPLLPAYMVDGDGTGAGTFIYFGSGPIYLWPNQLVASGIVHGGGGARSGSVGHGSVYGGGGGGSNGAGGASVLGGAGGAGSPGVAGTQPGGGGGGGAASANSGAGGAGRCRVTVF